MAVGEVASFPDEDVVLLSRVWVYRNFKGVPFVESMKDEDREQVVRRVRRLIDSLPDADGYTCYKAEDLQGQCGRVLAEHHLIPFEWMRFKNATLFLSADETIVMLVNGTEHLRIQAMLRGQQLEKAAEKVFQIDSQLNTVGEIAYDEQFGYLTQNIDLAGTGMQGELLLHLPVIAGGTQRKQIEKDMSALHLRFTRAAIDGIRDLAVCPFYRLTSTYTMGTREEEVLMSVLAAGQQLAGHERAVRKAIMNQSGLILTDRIMRSVGIFRYARVMSTSECLNRLSDLYLASSLGLLEYPLGRIHDCMCDMQNASLGERLGVSVDEKKLLSSRADMMRSFIADIPNIDAEP